MSLIHPNARIGVKNKFGVGVVIGDGINIGDNNQIGDYTSIIGNTSIGNDNVIGAGSVIGGLSNHVIRNIKLEKHTTSDEYTAITIGNSNIIGEHCTIHQPVVSITSIGSNVNIGPGCHIAHDVVIEDNAILSIHCGTGGYVRIMRGSNIGIGVNIHPRLVIGQYSMIGLGSVVIRHIIPGATVVGNPQRYIKPNIIGMERNKLTSECIDEISACLTAREVDLIALKSDAKNILQQFFKMVSSSNYVRNVGFVPFVQLYC